MNMPAFAGYCFTGLWFIIKKKNILYQNGEGT